jgi:hypothetical protein
MTQTEPNTRRPAHRRTKTALALLTATAALSGGTQALAPAPALAMNNQGNECQNLPTWERTVCEMEDAGGSGVPGGTAGGSNGSGGAPTIGHETIEVHDTPRPSHCQLSPSSCLPSMPGGRHQIGSDGVRPRGPRPGHRPVRVGEVAKGKTPTKDDCRKLKSGRFVFPSQEKVLALSVQLAGLARQMKTTNPKWWKLKKQESDLLNELKRLSGSGADAALIARDEEMLSQARHDLASVPAENTHFYEYVNRERDRAVAQLAADTSAMQKQCKSLYDISI